jgi:hypothetical protein
LLDDGAGDDRVTVAARRAAQPPGGDPRELACVRFLLADQAGDITGSVVTVDGRPVDGRLTGVLVICLRFRGL